MPPNSIQFPPEAAAALARGNVVEAVRIVRASAGLPLKEANDLVRAYANGQQAGRRGADPSAQAPFVFPPAAAAAVARGEFVTAIALLREANPRLDLKTAKEAIDQVRHGAAPVEGALKTGVRPNHPARVPTVVAGDRGSRGWLTLMLVGVFAVFVLWLLGGA
jgi:ribosomal protein L7/L12